MNKALKAILSLTAMLAAGCTDAAVSAPSAAPSQALMAKGGIPGRPRAASDTAVFSFAFNTNQGGVLNFGGGNFVNIPAGVVCDPFTSSYGPGTWDDACDLMKGRLVLTAKFWTDENNHPRVDFSPDIRFAPTADPSKFVVVTFADSVAANTYGTRILYCRSLTTGCVQERDDSTLTTVTDPSTGQVRRRVKHFSGYSITTGDDDESSNAMNRFVRGGLKVQP